MAGMMKDVNPKLKVCFVGPPVTVEPEKALREKAIDFVVRREFDYQVVDYANGKPLGDIPGVSFRRPDSSIQHNPEGAYLKPSTSCPGSPKSINAISTSAAITSRSLRIRPSAFTHRAAAPLFAPFASGPRRTPATAGGCGQSTMS